MKKLLAVIPFMFCALLPISAMAQTNCPTFVYGLVLTAAQWQVCFDAKLNKAGGAMSGELNTAAPTATNAGINFPPGTAPTIPANGDVWTTSTGIFARINGATVNLLNGSASIFSNIASLAAYATPTALQYGIVLNADGSNNAAVYSWRDPAPFTADGYLCITPTATGSWTGCWTRINVPEVLLAWYGVTTNTSDAVANTTKIRNAIAAAAYYNVPIRGYGITNHIPVNDEIDDGGGAIEDLGLTASGATGTFTSGGVLTAIGTHTDLGALAAQATANSHNFTLTTAAPSSVVPGSIISLVDKTAGSFNASLSYAYLGEAVMVASVSGTSIMTDNPLLFTYTTAHLASVKVNQWNVVNPRWHNVDVIGVGNSSTVVPIFLQYFGPNTELQNVHGSISEVAGIEAANCYGFDAFDVDGNTAQSTLIGDNYGVDVGNCAYVTFHGGHNIGGRIGTAIGGADNDTAIVDYLDGFVDGVIQTVTGQASPIPAADMHPQCFHCFYHDDQILGGVWFSAGHSSITNNYIKAGTCYGYAQYAIAANDGVTSADNDLSNNHIDECGGTASNNYAAGISLDSPGGFPYLSDGGTFDLSHTTMNFYVGSGVGTHVYQVVGFLGTSTPSASIKVDLSNSTFRFTGNDVGYVGAGINFYSTGTTYWDSIDISHVRGDVSARILDTNRLIADGFAPADLSDSSKFFGLPALYLQDIVNSATITHFHPINGQSYALQLAGTGAYSPHVYLDDIAMASGTFTANSGPVFLNDGASAGTGAIVTIDDYHVLQGSSAINTGANLTSVWFGSGEAAGYSQNTANANQGIVTANGTTAVTVSNTLVTSKSVIVLTPLGGASGKGAFVSGVTAGTSFAIASVTGDTSQYFWRIVSR